MTIWIHIGTMKTGTTTIQGFLSRNRGRIERLGYHYPRCASQPPFVRVHYNLASEMRAGRRKRSGGRLWGWDEVLREHRANPGTQLVISAETFEVLTAPRVLELRERLRGQDVRIVVYLRPQAEFLESLYSQLLKVGAIGQSIEHLIELRRPVLDYSRLLARWEPFGVENIHVRIFDRRCFVGGDLIEDFCSVIGLSPPSRTRGYVPEPVRNVSPGARALAMAHTMGAAFNAMGAGGRPDEAQGRARRLSIAAVVAAACEVWPEDAKPRLLDPRRAEEITRQFAPGNEIVRQRFRPDLSPGLFPAGPPSRKVAAPHESLEQIYASIPEAERLQVMALALQRLAAEQGEATTPANVQPNAEVPQHQPVRRPARPAARKLAPASAAADAEPDPVKTGTAGLSIAERRARRLARQGLES